MANKVIQRDNKKNGAFAQLDRRRQTSELYLKGYSQTVIAEKVGCTQSTVSDDLRWIQRQWLESLVKDFDEARAKELAKLDNLEKTNWEAWFKSCENAESTTRKTEKARKPPKVVRGKDGKGVVEPSEGLVPVKVLTEKSSKGQSGNPTFLTEIRSIIDMRLKLLGAYPKEVKATANVFNINWDDLARGGPEEPDPIQAEIDRVAALPALEAVTHVNGKSPGRKGK